MSTSTTSIINPWRLAALPVSEPVGIMSPATIYMQIRYTTPSLFNPLGPPPSVWVSLRVECGTRLACSITHMMFEFELNLNRFSSESLCAAVKHFCAVKMLISFQQKYDLQVQVQHKTCGERQREAGRAVLLNFFKMPNIVHRCVVVNRI